MELAQALIRAGMPPATVASEAGFYDQSHLSRHFKSLCGMTPGQYVIECAPGMSLLTVRGLKAHRNPPDGDRSDARLKFAELLPDLVALRRDLHAHPELAFEERRTAGIVAAALRGSGLEVHEGIAGTGVVGTLRHGSGAPHVGLRADMDALPIAEQVARCRMPAATPACTTAAATTATPRCCSAPRGSWRARGASTARSTSSSSPPKKAAAARA